LEGAVDQCEVARESAGKSDSQALARDERSHGT
jgi:hypothetical protein